MQINRLFEIVHLLLHQKQVTASALASHFEVSKRTILRDIDHLTTAGIPIYTQQGKGGGIFISPQYVLNKALMSPEERQQILYSLQSMAATQLVDTGQALGRLQSFFADPASTVTDWVGVDFSRWGHSTADGQKFDMIKQAILKEQALAIDYLSPMGEIKGLVVYPLRLMFKSKSWYLQSHCPSQEDHRVYKFNRISGLTTVDQPFRRGDYPIPSINTVEEPAAPEVLPIRLKIIPQAKYRIYDEFAEGDITPHADGTITVATTLGPWLYDYILSYGTAVEVLEPPHVREVLLARAEEIKNKYASKT